MRQQPESRKSEGGPLDLKGLPSDLKTAPDLLKCAPPHAVLGGLVSLNQADLFN